MTPPPTNIDGTDITGATIDGQDVDEITIDGQTVFKSGPPAPAPSLAHYWTFDNADTSGSTCLDTVGNKDGVIDGATTGVQGANDTYTTNEAYSFDGGSSDVELPTGVIPESGYSLVIWFKGTDPDGTGYIYRFRGDTDALLGRSSGSNAQNLKFWDGGGFVDSGVQIGDGKFRQAVETYDGTTMKGYVDGVEKLSVSASKTDQGENNNYIGNSDAQNRGFSGVIDDVRAYNKVLSPTEVSNLYNTGGI